VFFAALPEPGTLRQLEFGLKSLPAGLGRRVPVGNLHMTLAFVGAVSDERLNCLCEKANQIIPPDIDVGLERLGCFPRAAVLWLAPNVVPRVLADLAGALAGVLADCGAAAEPRPFSPHVTLARRVRAVPSGLVLSPVAWRSRGFALMESVSGANGVRYRVVQRYTLGG